MVKIKAISRSESDYTRERPVDMVKMHRTLDPLQHPFEKSREYTRALNATKLEKLFAKPFVESLDGHRDGVFAMAKHPKALSTVISGSCNGEIIVWNLLQRECVWKCTSAHDGFVRGLTASHTAPWNRFLSCGTDKTVKMWDLTENKQDVESNEPVQTWLGKYAFTGIDDQRGSQVFVTCGASVVDVWDQSRSTPIHSYEWGTGSVITVKFNPIETDIVSCSTSDRAIQLYDLRTNSAIRKVVLEMKSNAMAWNPMEAFNFTVANEDCNLYTFDMRKLEKAIGVHKDHVKAVLDVDYCPTGREIVSGSYDKTVRIFRVSEGKSREVYHTKRMQRIYCVEFSGDSKYVLSGSDDTNIRLWKTNAAEPLGVLLPREKQNLNYKQKVKERYKHVPEIARIDRHRHLPSAIHKAKVELGVIKKSQKRKEENRIKHSAPGAVPIKHERKKHVVETFE